MIVADAIRRVVVLGGLAEGERLPTERELAIALETSRATIRRALHALVEDGLIQIRKGRSGGSVVAPAVTHLRRPISAHEDVGRALEESREFRLALEPIAAALATERGTASERRAILALGTRPTPQSCAMYHAQDRAFHLSIATMSGNGAIRDALMRHFQEFFVWANSPFLVQASYVRLSNFSANHKPVAEAIAAGDPQHARQAMETHLVRAYGEFAAAFSALVGNV